MDSRPATQRPTSAGRSSIPALRRPSRARRTIAGLLCAVSILACSEGPEAAPSILLVTLDTVRRDHVTPYTSRPVTPRLAALAAAGRRYTAAYTTMPTTGPAHASLFTGQHPFEHGVRKNGMRLRNATAQQRSLAAQLKARGYATGAFLTARVMGSPPLGLAGFDATDVPLRESRPGANAVERAVQWLDEAPADRPVFLWVHLFDAHSPYGRDDEKRDAIPIDRSIYGWVDRERFRGAGSRSEMAERYARGVAQLDAAFGRLWDFWRERIGDKSLVIVVADHGEFLDEHLDDVGFAYGHGALLDEPVLRIPLLLSGSGVEPGVSPEAVSIRDLYTTILEAAKVGDPLASREDRRDLRRGEDTPTERVVSAERRKLGTGYWRQHGVAQPPTALVGQHSVAVASRDRLLVLDEQGEPLLGEGEIAPTTLLSAGRERARAYRGEGSTQEQFEVDADVREALRGLGYAE